MSNKNSITDEISLATKNYIQRMGIPPQILEHSDQLEKVELPEGLQLVTHSVRIPKNILLIGVQDEKES